MPARKTLARAVETEGIALHCGAAVRIRLAPAPAGTGLVFRRTDLNRDIPARYDAVTETRLGTVIARDGASVGVIEHLMAAIAGIGLDDLVAEINGPEPPILDGDALCYLKLLERAGVVEQALPRRAIKVLRTVRMDAGEAWACLSPSASLSFEVEIAFASAAIGRQTFYWPFSPGGFRSEIAPARTFGFVHELDALRKAGLGRGASLENTLAIDGDQIANPALQRFPDEFVRHKILDALGDLALAGGPLIGRFKGVRSGHALNNALLRALFADPANYAWTQGN